MQNSIWFFGDCFTWGVGCEATDEYYSYKTQGDEIWTRIVSSYFNMQHKKPHFSLGATMYIIVNFINYMKYMEDGDIIVISDSEVKSTLSISRNKEKVKCISSFNLEGFDGWHNKKEKQTVTQFIDNQIVPYEKVWETFYIDTIKNLAIELYKRNIKTIFWSHHLWKTENRFEDITQSTKGIIKDPHFSWKGHKDFANYIINQIKNKEWIKTPLI